jgi:hypothetical protein
MIVAQSTALVQRLGRFESCSVTVCVGMYYTSGFRTETMYNYYIIMKFMF